MPKTRKPLSKSDFIRSQPATLSAADVVAKGKAAGVKFSSQLVYKVRGRASAKKGKPQKTSTAKPTLVASKSPATSKAAFIRSLPKDMPVAEVIAKGKAQGLKIAETYVSWARWAGKTAAKKKVTKLAARVTKASAPTTKPTPRATPGTSPPVARPITTTSSAENLLKALGAELGLGRAIEILAGERARVRSILMG